MKKMKKKLENKEKKIKLMKKEQNEILNQKIKLKNEMREKKNQMLKHLNNIINKQKIFDKNEIYKKIFSNEDFEILNLRKSNSNINIVENKEKTFSNFFMTLNKRKFNSTNLSKDENENSDFMK